MKIFRWKLLLVPFSNFLFNLIIFISKFATVFPYVRRNFWKRSEERPRNYLATVKTPRTSLRICRWIVKLQFFNPTERKVFLLRKLCSMDLPCRVPEVRKYQFLDPKKDTTILTSRFAHLHIHHRYANCLLSFWRRSEFPLVEELFYVHSIHVKFTRIVIARILIPKYEWTSYYTI